VPSKEKGYVELLVLSDDFTGALDTGVQFAKQGVRTSVTSKLDLTKYDLDFEGTTALVINTESRHLKPCEAHRKVKKVTLNFVRLIRSHWGEKALNRIKFYKKTDSLLRGNVGEELTALSEAVASDRLMFVPGFPQTGRTTVHGVQLVGGTPIHESSFAKDRLNPIPESSVSGIVQRNNRNVATVIVGLDAVRANRPLITESGGHNMGGVTVYVFDAVTDDDLDRVGRLLRDHQLMRVTAGCAGFAGVLPDILELPRHRIESATYRAPLLVLCGSLTELSRRQVEIAVKHGFRKTSLGIEEKLLPDFSHSERGRKIIEGISDQLQSNKHCIIATGDTTSREEVAYAKSRKIDTDRIASLIAENLAGLVRGILNRFSLSTLVIFGGDTTMALMKVLGIESLTPQEEIMPGVPVSVCNERNLCLITKSGGFGDEDVLVRIMNRSMHTAD